MAIEKSRRDFLGIAFGSMAAVGGILALGAMKATWDPIPSVMAQGFTTVDLSGIKPGEFRTIAWRGKPIFILRKDKTKFKQCNNRDTKIGEKDFLVVIGLCTHLGCIPAWEPDKNIFYCACHGGEFDSCGINIYGPPPRPLDIPPYKITGTKLVLGELGPKCKALIAKNPTNEG